MATIGDFLPENIKNEIANENLKVGSIFRTFEHNTTPPKIKRFIVVGVSTNAVLFATVYINTEINPRLFNTPELQSLHLPISADGREYIDHDSHIDCSQLLERNINDLKAIYLKDLSCHIGTVSTDDLKLIRKIIKENRTIPIKKKKDYGLFF